MITRRELLGLGASAGFYLTRAAAQSYPPESLVQEDPLLRLPSLEPLQEYLLPVPHRNLPGTRRWDFGLFGGIDQFGTTESVGDGAASRFVFTAADMAAAGGPGLMWHQDVVVGDARLDNYAGISFWVKGDGSTARGSIGFDYSHSNPHTFSLSDTDWRKVFIRWEDFNPPVDQIRYHPGFSLVDPEPERDHFYVIDRVRLFTDQITEIIEPTPRRDLPGRLPAEIFVSNRAAIAETLSKLGYGDGNGKGDGNGNGKGKNKIKLMGRGGSSTNIVLVGDSIIDCAQLFYVFGLRGVTPAENAVRRRREYGFGSLAGDAVAEMSGFDTPNIVHETFEGGRWTRHFGDDLSPRGRNLNWITLGFPGRASDAAVEQQGRIFAYEPNLIVYNLGVNDFRNGRPDDTFFVPNVMDFVNAAKARGIEVVLCTPVPTSQLSNPPDPLNHTTSPYARSFPYAQAARDLAAQTDCALVDFHAAYHGRGVHAIGELQADEVHSNHLGHRLMANVLIELFTGAGLEIWERGAG